MAISDYLSSMNDYTAPAAAAATSANNAYAGAAGAAATLPDKLKQALNDKLNNNADIIGQQNSSLSDYIAAPATARAKYQDVFNPFDREKLVATARAQALQPYSTFSDILSNRMGQVSDIVNSGVSGWQSLVQQAQALAQAAQQRYTDAMSQYMNAAGLQQNADTAATQQSQYNTTLAENKRQFDVTQANKNNGTGTGITGVTKADQLTAQAWEQMTTDAATKYPDDYKKQSDYIWTVLNRDQGSYAKAGINTAALWQYQNSFAKAANPTAAAPAAPAVDNSGLNWQQKLVQLFAPGTYTTPTTIGSNLPAMGNVPNDYLSGLGSAGSSNSSGTLR